MPGHKETETSSKSKRGTKKGMTGRNSGGMVDSMERPRNPILEYSRKRKGSDRDMGGSGDELVGDRGDELELIHEGRSGSEDSSSDNEFQESNDKNFDRREEAQRLREERNTWRRLCNKMKATLAETQNERDKYKQRLEDIKESLGRERVIPEKVICAEVGAWARTTLWRMKKFFDKDGEDMRSATADEGDVGYVVVKKFHRHIERGMEQKWWEAYRKTVEEAIVRVRNAKARAVRDEIGSK